MATQDPISGKWYTGKAMYTPADAERERQEAARISKRWAARMGHRKSWWRRLWAAWWGP